MSNCRGSRNYRSLSDEQKDEVIELLLDKLELEIVDPYEWGSKGIELVKKE